jgi:hypothetical protein
VRTGVTSTTQPLAILTTDKASADVATWFNSGNPVSGYGLLYILGPCTYGAISVKIPVKNQETIYCGFLIGGYVVMYFDLPSS